MSGADHLHAVLFALRPLQNSTAKVLGEVTTDIGLSLPERAIMEVLNATGESTVPTIGRALLLPRQVVQRLADAVHERGLIEYVTNPAHRRSRLLRLSAAGRQLFDELLDRELRLLEPVADTLDPEDMAACARVMAALNAAMHTMAQQIGDPAE
ncbi:MarR family winged helix-turn-helix transcriptional regulator [Kutzneria sp. NPDC052558]|uniref:MarR family winged helix-turn-helix transcriptional regulator n=1 Tax=Kutzneria sp. NPDC052558 TaxID=3364121 RepID=UPI0037C66391